MGKVLPYIIVLSLCLAIDGCKERSGLPDLRETYSSRDTKPFGSNIAFRIIQNSFPDNYIQQTKLPFENASFTFPDTASLYFCVAGNFSVKEEHVNALLDFVYSGNTIFLSAANIDSVLLQKIYCKVSKPDVRLFIPPFFRETSVRLSEQSDPTKKRFSYFYLPFSSSFSEINDIYCRVVGYNENDQPNCIVFFWGKGKMFLHTDPRVFSNYFLLKNDNYQYLQQLLELLDPAPQHVYWNDHYHMQSGSNGSDGDSSLDAILKFPPLATAFWISLFLLLLFVLFEIKRRQRIIKQISPNVNSSVAFTETIARLYLQRKDNKNIAEKMITYFNEYVRSNYFIHTNVASDDYIKTLSRKSGVSLEKTTALYHAIDHANRNAVLDDYQLLSLNDQIQQFYKKRK